MVPVGSTLIQTVLELNQPFDGSATIATSINSAPPTPLQTISDNNSAVKATYEVDNWLEIDITNAGNIVCVVSGSPTQGQAVLVVEFVSAPVG